eukprot:4626714-Karenia_brevis.AAC.1
MEFRLHLKHCGGNLASSFHLSAGWKNACLANMSQLLMLDASASVTQICALCCCCCCYCCVLGMADCLKMMFDSDG